LVPVAGRRSSRRCTHAVSRGRRVIRRGRFGAAIALAWYLTVGFGVPLADGVLFHEQESPRTAHVESSDSQCHRSECSLDAPGAPQPPAGAPANAPAIAAVGFVDATTPLPHTPRSRSLARANAPRAPPQYT